MKIKRIAFGFLVLSLLACNVVTQMVFPSTATPIATATASATATPSLTATSTALVPAFIPPECAKSPLATVPADLLLQATPDFKVTEISKDEQLKILSDLDKLVQENYVYPDFNGNDWSAIVAVNRAKVKKGLDTQAFYDRMYTMITELGDDHSFFLSPAAVAETEAEVSGDVKFVGVGIYGQADFQNPDLTVVSTFPDSAAEHAGIQAHDTILLVDGHPIDQQFSNRLRGPECSTVIVKVQSPGEAARDVMLMRYPIEGNVPVDARLVTTRDGSKIGYIFLPSFLDETLPGQVEEALNKFGPLDGLILDLRMNGGGSSSVTYPIMEYFIHGKVGEFVSRDSSRPLEIQENEIQNSQSVPMVVLVGKNTASFAEIFAGVMKDSGRAKVVGETSLGNVEVLHGFNFADGSQVWIAAETFHSAFSDANWEETGIVPDVQASAAWNTFYFDNDPSVAAALKVLGHQ